QVNKARLLEKIADLVRDKKIEGISGLRDESDKDGMHMVIELRRGEVPEVILNNLYKQTSMQSVFGINMVALVDGRPRTLNLKQILEAFISHRREVVTRRTVFELRRARERGHVLEGMAIALNNIDQVIALIKASANAAEAREKLALQGWPPGAVAGMLERAGSGDVSRPENLEMIYGLRDGLYHLSPAQAKAILDLQLHRLTGLEQEKIVAEYEEILEEIKRLVAILADPALLMKVIREELEAIREQYGDERRTEIITSRRDLTHEDLITEEHMVATVSHGGYAKIQPLDTYQAQKRGGRGKSATAMKDEDYIEHLIVASTHDTILCFTSRGKVYWLKVYQLPQAGRGSRGKPLVNILPLDADEKVTSILPLREYAEGQFVFMATSKGTVKKVTLESFSRPRPSGLIAVELSEDDTLVGVAITDGTRDMLMFSSDGKAMRFSEGLVRPMGRTARGVRGIRLSDDAKVISLIVIEEHGQVLTASVNGYGKRTPMEEFPCKGRGGRGVIAMQMSERNGELVGAVQVFDGDEFMLISDQGTLVRTRVDEVSLQSRNTQGVRLIKVVKGEHLVGLERIDEPEVDETEEYVGDSEASSSSEEQKLESPPSDLETNEGEEE
ncbi:MAG: DNA gyrase subunit A, partial [Pseudomonadales bacterium]|nr:DNA gyrase subunit A [Pseudomonadales bacterium]